MAPESEVLMLRDCTTEEIAWAAGLFEGEGTICCVTRLDGRRGMAMRLSSTDRDVVDRFAALVGCGSISVKPPGTGGHKPLHEWYTQRSTWIRETARALRPSMGVRRTAQIDKALAHGADVGLPPQERTHCPRGHEYSEANTVIEARTYKGKPAPRRRCRACRSGLIPT